MSYYAKTRKVRAGAYIASGGKRGSRDPRPECHMTKELDGLWHIRYAGFVFHWEQNDKTEKRKTLSELYQLADEALKREYYGNYPKDTN